MIKYFLLLLSCVVSVSLQAQKFNAHTLPNSIYSGPQGDMHVQGIAVDQQNAYIYMSFTNKLLKMDMEGNVVASVSGFIGHLGDLEFDAKNGRIYGSLEFKNDAIGKGIAKKLGIKEINETGFYIAIFDLSKMTKMDLNAEKDDVVKCIYIKEAVNDYNAKVKIGDKEYDHRFACSGIDGIALAPSFENPKDGKKYLYVAYGVYGDTTRNDNDNQVILKYDISNWDTMAQVLSQDNFHHSGPQKPTDKYFLKTGNTNWGIQNLAFDEDTGNFYAAVYKGKKSIYPNYNLFAFNLNQKPKYENIISDNQTLKVKSLTLLAAGSEKNGIRGWYFKWGSTGLIPLGNGLFYISHNKKTKDKQEETIVYKYKWIGSEQTAFERVK